MIEEPILIKKENIFKKLKKRININKFKFQNKRNIPSYLVMLVMLGGIGILFGTSYALIQKSIVGNNTISMQTGDFLVEFVNTDTITLSNNLPMYDDIALENNQEFIFSVINTGDYKANYTVRIEDTSTDNLSEVIRYSVDSGNGYNNIIRNLKENYYIVENKSLEVGNTDRYKLKFWIDIDATEIYANKVFSGKIVIEATQAEYKYGTNVIESIYELEEEGLTAIGEDGNVYTSGNVREYRYTGSNPDNYVWFNCDEGFTKGESHCEKWQIIGSFEKDYENSVSSYRMLKIIKETPLTTKYPFNTNEGNLGDFKESSLESYLNSTYYNSLKSTAKKMIMKTKWDSSDTQILSNINDICLSELREGHYNNIGLLSISDYIYSTIDNAIEDNWLNKENSLLLNTPNLKENSSYYITENGITTEDTTTSYSVRPVVYLKADVSIINGFGTSDDPYQLEINYEMNYGKSTPIKLKNYNENEYILTLDTNGGVFSTTYTTPEEHIYIVPETAQYKIELWGAQGGNATYGGKGAYTSGTINLEKNEKLYFYVGGEGLSNASVTNIGGYNGGGYSGNNSGSNSYGGGGATDVRLIDGIWNNSTGLNSRIMVAAGGAGTAAVLTSYAGNAGGLIGYSGTSSNSTYNTSTYLPIGANQIGVGFAYGGTTRSGSFGYALQTNSSGWGGGGGGGYYGGNTGHGTTGSGGSSYISGHTGCVAVTSETDKTPKSGCTTGTTDNACSIHYSNKVFQDTIMIDGIGYSWTNVKGTQVSMPSPNSGNYSLGVGNTGNGAAKITQVVTPKNIKNNDMYGKLPIPTREGYGFIGWFTEKEGGIKIDESSIVSIDSDIKLYAHWSKQEDIKIILDDNYGSSVITYTAAGQYTYTTTTTASELKLEVWGAQGGKSIINTSPYANTSGYGGYSVGTVNLDANTNLYVVVGGQGGTAVIGGTAAGGYNGGGSGSSDGTTNEANGSDASGGGGGATHIALTSGLLSSFSSNSNRAKILIVAGGGGGESMGYDAGSGGGWRGTTTGSTSSSYPTQTSGYAFGKGQNGWGIADNDGVAGGGGGYYGGYANNVAYKSSGTGGSGYIGSSLLTNKAMYCYKCVTSSDVETLTYTTTNVSSTPTANYAKSGSGAAKITELKKYLTYKPGSALGMLPTPTRSGYTFLGWFTEKEGGNQITADTIVGVEDTTFYAHWS